MLFPILGTSWPPEFRSRLVRVFLYLLPVLCFQGSAACLVWQPTVEKWHMLVKWHMPHARGTVAQRSPEFVSHLTWVLLYLLPALCLQGVAVCFAWESSTEKWHKCGLHLMPVSRFLLTLIVCRA